MVFPTRTMVRSALLANQANGRLDPAILTRVPGQAGGATVTLIHPAARAWKALAAAALKAGHVLKTGWPSSSYRTYAEQERIFRDRYTTTYLAGRPYKVWNGRRWYQKPGTAVAAVPGTSNHGWASAVDAGEERDSDAGTESFDDPTLRWLIANADRFGWSWEVQSEPWHLRYNAGDRIPAAVIAFEKPPPTTIKELTEAPMANLIKGSSSSTWYISDGIHKRALVAAGSQTVQEQVDELVGSGTITAGVYNQPWPLDQDTVNQIPTV